MLLNDELITVQSICEKFHFLTLMLVKRKAYGFFKKILNAWKSLLTLTKIKLIWFFEIGLKSSFGSELNM